MRARGPLAAVWVIYGIGACLGRAPDALTPAPDVTPTPPPARTFIFISDLHFGVGRNGAAWHPFEDSRWPVEFSAFLKKLDEDGGGATDLILVGDTFELWQSRSDDCRYADKDLGCEEGDAIARLKGVLGEHATEIDALKAFASARSNSVVLIPGNHDAALLFEKVQKTLLERVAPARVSIEAGGYWISPDHRVYAEHGHQIGKDPGCFKGWPAPFLKKGEHKYIRRPWGERFVREFYNAYELKYPIVDNITDETVAIRYALAAEGNGAAVKGVKDFFRLMVFGSSWAQFRSFLGEGDAAQKWDYDAIRKHGDGFFLELLPPDDPMRAVLAEQAKAPGGLGISLQDLSNDDLKALCDKQLLRRRQAQQDGAPLVPPPCPSIGGLGADSGLGAVVESLFRKRNAILSDHLDGVRKRLKSEKRDTAFQTFVYGHTHVAEDRFRVDRTGWNPWFINTGAWQRVISPSDLLALQKKKGWSDAEALTKQPEDLPACYSFVRIREGADEDRPVLKYWRQDESGQWDEADTCH